MKEILFLLGFIAISISCSQKLSTLSVSEVKFNTVIGVNESDSSQIYCLLGTGFFRAPSSDDSDRQIKEWIEKHPKAMVIPVSSMRDGKSAKMTYCIVVDGKDTLNNYLIRNGCFPGGTMQRPQTWNEMSKSEKSTYLDLDLEKPDVKIWIDTKSYNAFMAQIQRVENYAIEHKLGIWSDPEKHGL